MNEIGALSFIRARPAGNWKFHRVIVTKRTSIYINYVMVHTWA